MRPTVAVVGAGPAGLMAALRAAETGAAVILLEGQDRPGRKLLISGSGMCNLTHAGPIEEFLTRYGEAGRFVKPCLHAFDNAAVEVFFTEQGCPLETAEGGKVFPQSRDARQVLSVLLDACLDAGVELHTGCALEAAEREGPPAPPGFRLHTRRGSLRADRLIIATGGLSYPITGSTGDGLRLAAALGHRIVTPRPSLAPIIAVGWDAAAASGISFADARLRIRREGRVVCEASGDVLFTHQGLSGPGILDASRSMDVGDVIELALLSDAAFDAAAADKLLAAACAAHPARSLRTLLGAWLPGDALPAVLARRAGADPEARAAVLGRDARRALAAQLAAFSCTIARVGSWKTAMATAGGIERSAVDPRTMASRLVPGLFFAGEVLDVDGDTGGFNIQFALSSGHAAGQAAGKELP